MESEDRFASVFKALQNQRTDLKSFLVLADVTKQNKTAFARAVKCLNTLLPTHILKIDASAKCKSRGSLSRLKLKFGKRTLLMIFSSFTGNGQKTLDRYKKILETFYLPDNVGSVLLILLNNERSISHIVHQYLYKKHKMIGSEILQISKASSSGPSIKKPSIKKLCDHQQFRFIHHQYDPFKKISIKKSNACNFNWYPKILNAPNGVRLVAGFNKRSMAELGKMSNTRLLLLIKDKLNVTVHGCDCSKKPIDFSKGNVDFVLMDCHLKGNNYCRWKEQTFFYSVVYTPVLYTSAYNYLEGIVNLITFLMLIALLALISRLLNFDELSWSQLNVIGMLLNFSTPRQPPRFSEKLLHYLIVMVGLSWSSEIVMSIVSSTNPITIEKTLETYKDLEMNNLTIVNARFFRSNVTHTECMLNLTMYKNRACSIDGPLTSFYGLIVRLPESSIKLTRLTHLRTSLSFTYNRTNNSFVSFRAYTQFYDKLTDFFWRMNEVYLSHLMEIGMALRTIQRKEYRQFNNLISDMNEREVQISEECNNIVSFGYVKEAVYAMIVGMLISICWLIVEVKSFK